jgi:hypothetical protein
MMAQSQSVMEDDAQGVTVAGTHAADAVAHVDPIEAAGTRNGPVMDGESYGVALAERDDFGAGLHARALLGKNEFTAGEIAAGFGEEEGDLYGEDMFSIQILMEAVIVARSVLEEQRRGTQLAGLVAAREEVRVFRGELDGNFHGFVPAVCYGGQLAVEVGTERLYDGRQGVMEVLVFAAAETVAGHDDLGAEEGFVGVEGG